MDFIPKYDDTVREYYVYRPDLTMNINPSYCLMPLSAIQLTMILKDLSPKIEMRDPWSAGGPWRFNHQVPWLVFPDGNAFNAALLAGWWTMAADGNYSMAMAEQYCRENIAGTL